MKQNQTQQESSTNSKTQQNPKDKKIIRYSLDQALKIGKSIEESNAGNPYNRIDLCRSLDLAPNGSTFRLLLVASNRYGLTKGNYNANKIKLTELGSSIVAPINDENQSNAIKQVIKTSILGEIIDYYNNKQIPRIELFKNTLKKEFQVNSKDVDLCYDVFMDNAKEYNLIQEIKGKQYLKFDNVSVKPQSPEEKFESLEQLKKEEPETNEGVIPPTVTTTARVFLSHSKNKTILDQIKKVLTFGKFEFEIAVEEETTAIPIPEKIFGLMRKCNCAIINVSADEQEKRDDGIYGINQNVLIEIGAAFLQYNRKVILLVDKRVNLPSNLQGLYKSEYEGEELSWDTGVKLQEALSNFRQSEDIE